jgi:hypothetical protein
MINANIINSIKMIWENNTTLSSSLTLTNCTITNTEELLSKKTTLTKIGLPFQDLRWIDVYKRCPSIQYLTVTDKYE